MQYGGGGSGAMLILDGAVSPPITFRLVCLAVSSSLRYPTPVTYLSIGCPRWKDAITKEMTNLKSHNMYEVIPHVPGMCTLRLGWVRMALARGLSTTASSPTIADHHRPLLTSLDMHEVLHSPCYTMSSLASRC